MINNEQAEKWITDTLLKMAESQKETEENYLTGNGYTIGEDIEVLIRRDDIIWRKAKYLGKSECGGIKIKYTEDFILRGGHKFKKDEEDIIVSADWIRKIKKEKDMKTTEQTVEIKINVPEGWEATGEYRAPKEGEYYLGVDGGSMNATRDHHQGRHIILKPKVKSGKELVGCLCGVSYCSMEDAKKDAEELFCCEVITKYIDEEKTDYQYETASDNYTYAYPVSEEKIQEMLENLRK